MDFQTLESDGQHLCQLCGEMKENVIKGRPDFITLVKRTLGYINIEFIDDIILGKWLCANCLVDAESSDTFLCKVEEGQRKLRQQIPEGIGTLEHIKIEKSEEMPIVKLEPDNTEYTVTEAVATPTCAQFSEDNHAMCFIEKEDYDMDNNTDMLCAKNSMTYSNHLDNETTETEEAPSHSQTSLNYTATTYIKTEDYPLNNHTAIQSILDNACAKAVEKVAAQNKALILRIMHEITALRSEFGGLKKTMPKGYPIMLPKQPFESIENVLLFEIQIKEDEEKFRQLKSDLNALSSSKSKKFVKQAWSKIMTDEVAEKMSWRGTETKICARILTIALAIRQAFVHENGGDEAEYTAGSKSFFQYANNRLKLKAHNKNTNLFFHTKPVASGVTK